MKNFCNSALFVLMVICTSSSLITYAQLSSNPSNEPITPKVSWLMVNEMVDNSVRVYSYEVSDVEEANGVKHYTLRNSINHGETVLYEINGKVFMEQDSESYPIMDFSVADGDSIQRLYPDVILDDAEYIKVATSTIAINGTDHKLVKVDNGYSYNFWLEGIGAMNDFYITALTMPTDYPYPTGSKMLEFSDNNKNVFFTADRFYSNEWIESDGLRFIPRNDGAMIVGCTAEFIAVDTIEIPNYVMLNDEKVPVSYINTYSIANQNEASVNVKKLILPETIKGIEVMPFRNITFDEIQCNAKTPPTTLNIPNSESTNLLVPAESIEAYRNAPGWNLFREIKAIDGSAIVGIATDSAEEASEYYNLQGVKIANLTPGTICIERRGIHARKVKF